MNGSVRNAAEGNLLILATLVAWRRFRPYSFRPNRQEPGGYGDRLARKRSATAIPDTGLFPQETPMTDLLVLGGSGRLGIHVLARAAARGHRVRALVRNPEAVQAPAGVELVQGTPANIDDLRKAAQGSEAVISALNNSRASENPWAKPVSPPMFMTGVTRDTLTVMGEQNIRRIVVTSTQGAGDDWARINPVFRALIKRSTLKAAYDDHHGVDQIVRASDTDWTLARPVALSDKQAGAPLRAAEAGTDKPGTRISRADVADFLLDTVEQGTWIHKAPLVWNTRG
jgi:uncharacterized protein YbjT (DUF2867 family)